MTRARQKLSKTSILKGEDLDLKDLKPVHEIFTQNATLQPNNIAAIYTSRNITYKELDIWSNKIAYKLSSLYNKGERVAIITKSPISTVASILGTMKAGLIYFTLDHLAPIDRLKAILADAAISAILTTNKDNQEIYNLHGDVHDVEEVLRVTVNDVNLSQITVKDSAYIMYTSGSTGQPKGVIINHKSLSISTLARNKIYPEQEIFLMLSPFFCDSALAGLWGTLTTGGTLVLTSYEENRDPGLICNIIKTNNVSTFLCIPSLYNQILNHANDYNYRMTSLKSIIVAGEVLNNYVIRKHFASNAIKALLFNEYGPTEGTIWTTYNKFDEYKNSNIGRPIPGITLYVMDEKCHIVSKGKKGELFIGSPQIALGYFNDNIETKKRFLIDPFSKLPEARIYKTGDIVRINHDNTIKFFGRRDNQVKIRGYRVEIEDIEKKLNEIVEVERGAVVALHNQKHTKLVGCILNLNYSKISTITEKLNKVLPSYMVPTKFFNIQDMPLTNNGKIDRSTLSKIVLQDIHLASQEAKLRNKMDTNTNIHSVDEVTSAISKIWEDMLNMQDISLDANFFDIGGHSLMIFQLQEKLQKHSGKIIPIVELFRNTTIASQTNLIQETIVEATCKI